MRARQGARQLNGNPFALTRVTSEASAVDGVLSQRFRSSGDGRSGSCQQQSKWCKGEALEPRATKHADDDHRHQDRDYPKR